APLFDRILDKAPEKLNTLVASGDTLIFSGKNIPEIPEADIVCFGLWLEPEKATNHGVFFAKHESPGQMQFMLQKPSIQTIKELVHQYYFLMDIGIWLLSEKAVNLLMKRCGWNGETYQNQIPGYYDLYTDFGMALGETPVQNDKDISGLTVALVNLEGGEFYHLGNTSELISSNLAIQNRITDQREIWHRQIKPHPSIFVLNANVQTKLNSQHNNIWIENSCISSGWELNGNHALTGIPENEWNLKLHSGNCLDLIPVSTQEIVIRNYGFTDPFRGILADKTTKFMDISLSEWLEKRGLSDAFNNLYENTDIQFLPLFPIIKKDQLSESFIQWLIDPQPEDQPVFTEFWMQSQRVSADQISQIYNIQLLDEQCTNNRLKSI
ncbi:MAG: L-fucokinase, partial [Bacteroidota bacterium]|nr:L-fucokinase [Bacteroidota bacterium]